MEVNGARLWLLGVRHTYDEPRTRYAHHHLVTSTPADGVRILLYTPDLMPVTSLTGHRSLPVNGHTRRPDPVLVLYGALATSSAGRCEHGRYRRRTTLYVSL